MKRILGFVLLMLLAVNAMAAGSSTITKKKLIVQGDAEWIILSVVWVGASNGALTDVTISGPTYGIEGYTLLSSQTYPGGTAPTDAYTISIKTVAGTALMSMAGSSTLGVLTNATYLTPVQGDLTFSLSGNSANAGTATCELYFSRMLAGATSSSGTIAATQSGIWSTRALDGAGNTIDSTSHALNSYVTNLTADVAEDSAFGTPASVAGRATTTERASVNTGDVVGLATDIKGRQIMMLNAPIEMKVNGNCTVNATTECDVIAANASYKICITEAAAVNTDGTNSEVVQILDNGAIGAGTLMFYLGAPSNGGHEKLLTSPYCTSAINHKITADSAGSANPVYISISGFLTAE